MAIQTESIEISVDGASMGGYLARPEGGGPFPGVIVWMEIFGVNSHIRDITERIAALGYVALAPDFFHLTAPGIELDYDETGFEEGMKNLSLLDADQMVADARAAFAFLGERSDVTAKIGTIGFCIGGHMAYLTACETDVVAAAPFYGGGIAAPEGPGGKEPTLSRTGKIGGRILCMFGGQDLLIPSDQVASITSALEGAKTRHEVVVYEPADHGFFCDQRATYHEESAANAWQRVEALFAEELAS
ncbi:MAG: dienelactone hydrolase family protein [Deltaproteobacteria bacterium]|nr:dienelactone hydrolase family protein [Deltaproteobacteria bacterium]MBW2392806.1 dienelactone hydrolase family protein [Deltaproteobacteria bacterium]